ncbi:MAG: hypothetical protein KAT14_00905 [Candidatus Marinimicrobia bacterium]|nr:hypothetical protein [Candidatus Neomarinimicrobiota bacterium]
MTHETFILYKTYYNKYDFDRVSKILNEAKIPFRSDNRSNTVNYRVPMSAYAEIELWVQIADWEKVEKLLEHLDLGEE